MALTGFAMALSGFVIQFAYLIGNRGNIDRNNLALGIDDAGWSSIHKLSTVIISFFIIAHIILHWTWYKTIVRKK